MAGELNSKGGRVNTISPGGTVTAIFAKAAGLEGAKAERALGAIVDLFTTVQLIPRAGITDEIARAAVFLASDAASSPDRASWLTFSAPQGAYPLSHRVSPSGIPTPDIPVGSSGSVQGTESRVSIPSQQEVISLSL